MFPFAYAETSDNWSLEWASILVAVGIAAGIFILVFIAATLARRRGHPHLRSLVAAGVVWGLVTAGMFIVPIVVRWHDQANEATLLKTGWYDPRDWPAPPGYPWVVWGVLLGAYVPYLAWAMVGKRIGE